VEVEHLDGGTCDPPATVVRRVGAVVATTALLLACGTALTSLGAAPAASVDGALGRHVRYVMTSPAAQYYTTDRQSPRAEVSQKLAAAFPRLRLSPCLMRAAAAYARQVPHDATTQPPLAAIEFMVHWAGCPDPSATATVLYTTEDSTEEVIEGVRELLAQPGLEGATHIGVARIPAQNPPFRWRWGILAVKRTVRLSSFPTSGGAGSNLPLQFQLLGGLTDPEVILLAADGGIEHLSAGAAGRWGLASIPLGHRTGTVWVEITADGPSGPEVCALFPVTVGSSPASAWEGKIPPEETDVRTPAEAEALMLELVNADRRRFGLPAVQADERLAAVARRHSEDMALNGFFGHLSPSRGGLAERLAADHYAIKWSGENISTSDSIYESQEALMRSPGHRANILAPQPTVVGIGIVREPAASRRPWVVTQIFAEPVLSRSALSFANAVRARIEGRRAVRGLAEIRPTRAVDEVTQQLAVRLRQADLSSNSLTPEAGRLLREAGVSYRRLTVLTYEVPDPADIALPEVIYRGDVDAVGIGAAPRRGEPLTTVVVLVLESRTEVPRP